MISPPDTGVAWGALGGQKRGKSRIFNSMSGSLVGFLADRVSFWCRNRLL